MAAKCATARRSPIPRHSSNIATAPSSRRDARRLASNGDWPRMTFFAIVFALALEQWRAFQWRARAERAFVHFSRYLERLLNGGTREQGIIATLIAVLLPVGIAALVHSALAGIHPLLGFAWSVAVLYLLMGFRRFSHAVSAIVVALRAGDLPSARRALAAWRDDETTPIGRERDRFGWPARALLAVLDWLPARLTALSFAVVGDFEDAIACWRTQAHRWANEEGGVTIGVLLAAGGGALGVRLGGPLATIGGDREYRPEVGTGDTVEPDLLPSGVGLVWRALLLWLLMILLLTVAYVAP